MEAVGELAPNQATRLGQVSSAPFVPVPLRRTLHSVPTAGRFGGRPASDGGQPSLVSDAGGSGDLARSLELLKKLSSTAVADAGLLDFREAADFAADVEEISRTAEYLQLVAARAVDRTRRQAAAAARSGSGSGGAVGWTTGWGETAVHEPAGWVTGPASQTDSGPGDSQTSQSGSGLDPSDPASGGGSGSAAPDPADDGYRNAAEFLHARLRISAAEARRRLALAAAVLPRTGFTGHQQPPERPELGAALAAGTVASRPATIITLALDRVRHHATEDTTARMEHALTRTAAENDTDFLSRVARRWTEAIDQDGAEPTEEELRHRQGAFLRPARRGLHHLEIFATPDQYEHLLTVMNTATNPRTRPGVAGGSDGTGDCTADENGAGPEPNEGPVATAGGSQDPGEDQGSAVGGHTTADDSLDRRTRPHRLLDGLVGACKAALATGTLPTAGGLRPQVMVTIDYRDLLDRLEHTTNQGPRYRSRAAATGCGTTNPDNAGHEGGTGNHAGPAASSAPAASAWSAGSGSATIRGTGSFTFTGPVTASSIRKIACDADIIPVLLGSQGRILDIGRTTRIFPPNIRKAITARDQGCAFPGCTIPAPWCEAHHITYWSHGGSTGTDNGTLLCSHHHHLIHKEQWTIQVKTGIPWFIPPPHIDPRQQPQRNNYFRLE